MFHLKEKYQKEVIPAMKEKFNYRNDMAIPKIERVVVNSGFGMLSSTKTGNEREKLLSHIMSDLTSITGQKPAFRKAKKSIAGFKLREGTTIGATITLRGKRMYDFLERLINIALPRTRDFKGLDQKSIDQKGNLTIGLREQIVFPEITAEKEKSIFGLEVTVVTTAKNKEEGMELLQLMGFPIKYGKEIAN